MSVRLIIILLNKKIYIPWYIKEMIRRGTTFRTFTSRGIEHSIR